MARKFSLSDIDYSNPNNTSDWAEELRQQTRREYETRNDPRNREAEGWAFIEALVNDGVELSDEDQIKILNDFIQTGGTTYTAPVAPPSFDNVESEVTDFKELQGLDGYIAKRSAELGREVDELKAIGSNLGAWGRRVAGSSAIAAADSTSGTPNLTSVLLGPLAGATRALDTVSGTDAASSLVSEKGMEFGREQFAAADAQTKRNDAILQAAADRQSTVLGREFVEGVSDVSQSGSSFLSVFGGPAAAGVTGADVYLQEYGQARLAGLSPNEAHLQATSQAAPEMALSAIPSRKILERIPYLNKGVEAIEKRIAGAIDTKLGQAAKVATDVVAGGTGEGLQESATFVAQDTARRLTGLVGSERAREYALSQAASVQEYPQELYKNFRAGFLMGGSIRGGQSAVETNRLSNEIMGLRTDSLESNILLGAEGVQRANQEARNAPVQEEAEAAVAPEPVAEPTITPEQKAAEEDAAWAQRTQERAREQNWEEARIPYENAIDLAREDVETLQEEVAAGARDSQTLNDLAAATRRLRTAERELENFEASRPRPQAQDEMTPVPEPEPVVEPPPTPEQLEAERVARVEQGERIEAIRKRQEELKKKRDEDAKKQEDKRKKEAEARRRQIIDELVEANPDATPAQLEQELQARLMVPAPNPKPAPDPAKKLADKVKSVKARMERGSNQRTGRQESARIEAYLKRNPNATVEETVAAIRGTAQAAPAPAPRAATPKPTAAPITKNDAELVDAEIEDFSDRMLGMSDPDSNIPADVNLEEFRPKARAIAKALVGKSGKASRSVQTLINQGKLKVIPSASMIGRKTNNRAEYSVESGEMYIYADKLENPNDAAAIIARALHEATHAGQFNDRDGRSNLYRQFLGDRRTSEAARKIRKAAENGNNIAKRAVAKAKADTAKRKGDDIYEDLEVVGYFTSEVVASRNSTLGSVGGVVRDMTSAARSFLRDNVGLDLDIDIGDLNTAAMGVGQEIANTEVRGLSSNPNVLGMIYNIDPDNLTPQQQQAIDNGYVYDSVDGNQKYVLTDEGSSIRPGAVEKLRKATGPVPLREVLDHPVLFEQSPDAANLPVYATDVPLGNSDTNGVYMPTLEEVYVNSSLLANPDELRGTLLHEVQHYLQDKAGLSEQFFDGNTLVAQHQELRDELEERTATLDAAARTFLDTAPAMLNSTQRGRVMRVFMQDANASDTGNAAKIRDYILSLDNAPPSALEAVEAYEEARRAYNDFIPQYREAALKAQADYLANIAEREAYFTQYNRDNPTTGVNPEPIMRTQEADPETGEDPTGGRIDVPIGNGITIPMSRDSGFLGMAEVAEAVEPYSATSSANFKRWFGNSQIRDSEGNPQVYYHGTPHHFDAFRTNRLGLIFASPSQRFAESFAQIDPLTLNQRDAIPLYVRAENLWDYENPEHREVLLNDPDALRVIDETYRGALAPEEARAKLAQGDWSLIEQPTVIEVIKDAGFDALTVFEGGSKNIAVFSPNQLKHATENSGEFSESPFFLASNDTAEDKPHRWMPASVTSFFQNSKGLGEDVLNKVELARSEPAYESMAAEALVRDYNKALDDLANERGVSTRDLSREIADKLEEANAETEKYSENKAAWETVLADYGKAGEVLLDMRNRADALSLQMIRLRRDQGGDLTPEEKRQYKAITANLGKYVHRMYASGSGKAGQRFSKAMWDAYQKSLSPKKKENMTDIEKQNSAIVQRALKVIVDDLVIPDDNGLAEMDRQDLERLTHTWISSASQGLELDEMRDRLASIRDAVNGDTDRLNNQARTVAKDLLGLLNKNVTTPLGTYYRGGKLDTGILQKRKNIDPRIREMLGEIRDPGVALLGTIGKQAEFVARNKMLLQLRDMVGPDLQPPDSAGTSVVMANKLTPLTGSGYGPLEGWYASPNMEALIGDTVEQIASLEQAMYKMTEQPGLLGVKTIEQLHDKWMKGASYTKAASILGNPFLFGINFAGSFDTMLMNGNYTSPSTQLQALKEAGQLIAYAVNPGVSTPATRLLARYGVIDSAQIGDIKNMNYKQIQKHIDSLIKKQGKRAKSTDMLKGIGLAYKETYAMMDVWAKIANFHQNVADLEAFSKAENNGWTQEEIYERAAATTKRLNISYQRAAPFIKALERNGVTMFGTYFYETFRVQVENMAEVRRELRAAKQATTPKGRNIMARRAAKRTVGIVASNAIKLGVMKLASGLLFGDDEDKWYNIRGLLPDFIDNQDFYPAGKDKNGNVLMFPISRLDPMGPNTDLLREVVNGNGDPEEVLQQLLDLYIAPRIGGAMALAIGQEFGIARVTREPTMQQLLPGLYGDINNVAGTRRAASVRAVANVVETAMPGIIGSWRKNNPRPVVVEGDGTLKGELASISSQLALYSTYAGNRLYKLDPNQSLRFAGFDYKDFDQEAKQQVKDYFRSQVELDPEAVQGLVADIALDEKKQWDKVRRIYLGMQAIGLSPSEINSAMKDAPLPNAQVRQSIISGSFKPTVVSIKSMESYRDSLMKGRTEEEKKEIKEKWDMVIDTLGQVLQDE